MPIRFRCVYCNKLLSISRRKTGTIVKCINCEGRIIVPEPSRAAQHAPAVPIPEPVNRRPDLFENGDFDDLLRPSPGPSLGEASTDASDEQAKPIHRPTMVNLTVPPKPPDVRANWMLISVAGACLVIGFLAGFLVARLLGP